MTEYFSILNEFKGFGDPSAKIWFIGIEEGGKWDEDPKKDMQKYEQYSEGWFCAGPKEPSLKYTTVYDIISKIMVGLGEQISNREHYRDNLLFKRGSGVFQSNLYPLAKPTIKKESWPIYYKTLFGFGPEDLTEYRQEVYSHRFQMLRKLWEKHSPALTVCFGSTYWNDFRRLLGLPPRPQKSLDDGYIELYEIGGRTVVLTPFFSYRRYCMPDDRTKTLVALLRQTGFLPEPHS